MRVFQEIYDLLIPNIFPFALVKYSSHFSDIFSNQAAISTSISTSLSDPGRPSHFFCPPSYILHFFRCAIRSRIVLWLSFGARKGNATSIIRGIFTTALSRSIFTVGLSSATVSGFGPPNDGSLAETVATGVWKDGGTVGGLSGVFGSISGRVGTFEELSPGFRLR